MLEYSEILPAVSDTCVNSVVANWTVFNAYA